MYNKNVEQFGMNKTQTNILMTQIRAERKMYKCRHQPVFINSHRDQNRVGKRIFKEQLYNTTSLFIDHQDLSKRGSYRYSPLRSPSKSVGKRTGYEAPLQRSPHKGKRRGLEQKQNNFNLISFDPFKRVEMSPYKFTKKRLDHSPNHQNKLSPGFNLFKNISQ